ncbi:hypothetical protein PCL_12678 [Purpureocillium lilacinum]|uniref:Uncharacterized protein n=1 Tax=Purpureocillium lilacinum TaxID=33203 RepID=A0A2U3DPC6_PURLI|nr:hypothetical protein PCL_12678 [Purpureocillium lilacinum]
MAQYWELVNIDKQAQLRSGLASNFWEYLMYTPTEQLVGLLRKCHWIRFSVPRENIRVAKIKHRSSAPIRPPQEIIDRIAHFVASDRADVDLVCLALTCSYFVRLLGPAVQVTLRRDRGPWAGDRLVFLGDNGCLAWVHPEVSGIPFGCTTAEGRFARRSIRGDSQPIDGYGLLPSDVKRRLKGERGGLRRFRRLLRMLTLEPSGIAGDMKPVLRNLTTMEYVRDEALAESEFAYSLGEIIMVQTIWTGDSKDIGRLGGTKARWAGHRFDVSVMAEVTGNAGWTDVSDEAVQRITTAATERLKKTNGRRAYYFNVRV